MSVLTTVNSGYIIECSYIDGNLSYNRVFYNKFIK